MRFRNLGAEGTYFSSTAYTLRSGVGIYGGFAATETNRNQRNWVTHPTKLSSSSWFTIDIYPTAGNPIDSSARLDGVIVDGADNALSILGYEASASPVFVNCVFKNTKNPATYLESCSLSFLDCTFDNNNTLGTSSPGGALYVTDSTVTVDRCTFRATVRQMVVQLRAPLVPLFISQLFIQSKLLYLLWCRSQYQ